MVQDAVSGQTFREDPMKMKDTVLQALHQQIKMEFDSAMLYLSMASNMYEAGLDGFGHWLRVQYREELEHGLKIFDYLVERDEKVVLQALDKPFYEWHEPYDLFNLALEHEQLVTKSINDLLTLAKREEDYATDIFLHWYVTEQLEEEHQVRDILDKIRIAKDCGNSLLLIDSELALRQFSSILPKGE